MPRHGCSLFLTVSFATYYTAREYRSETRRVTALCVRLSHHTLTRCSRCSRCVCVCVFVLFRRVQRVCLRFRLCARGDQYPLARLLPLPMRQRYIIEVALRSSLMKLLRKQDRPGTNLRVEKLRASYGHIRTPYTRENRVFLLPFSLSFSFFLKE